MSDPPLKTSAGLEQALGRLVAAVDRLERAVDGRATDSGLDPEAALAAALSESARLRQTQAVAAEQLDVTIARLRGVLGG
ncbi:MAG: hypothetical protein ACFCUO_07265 [Rhodospirillales bacterium]